MSTPKERREQFKQDYRNGLVPKFKIPDYMYKVLIVFEDRKTFNVNFDDSVIADCTINDFLDYLDYTYQIKKMEESVCEINNFIYNYDQPISQILKADDLNIVRFYQLSLI